MIKLLSVLLCAPILLASFVLTYGLYRAYKGLVWLIRDAVSYHKAVWQVWEEAVNAKAYQ